MLSREELTFIGKRVASFEEEYGSIVRLPEGSSVCVLSADRARSRDARLMLLNNVVPYGRVESVSDSRIELTRGVVIDFMLNTEESLRGCQYDLILE